MAAFMYSYTEENYNISKQITLTMKENKILFLIWALYTSILFTYYIHNFFFVGQFLFSLKY